MSRLSAKCTLSVNHEFILFMIKKKDFDYRQLCKNDIRNFSTLLDTPICHFYLSRSFPKYDLTTKISLLCGYGG